MSVVSAAKQITLSVVKSAFGGDGIAHYQGKVYFVEGALPGEEVTAGVLEEKKNFSRVRLIRVLKASPHRLEPACHYASRCGGCQYQHVSYVEELRLKESQLSDILRSIPEVDLGLVSPIIASDREHGYRNGVTLHTVGDQDSRRSSERALGYIGKDNISKLVVKNCLIADERLSALFGGKFKIKKGISKLTARVSENGQIITDVEEVFFRARLLDESFLVSSKGFFQNNLFVAGLVAAKVADWAKSVKPDVFFDLYAGVGIFSILSVAESVKVVSVEESAVSAQAMRMNREEKKRCLITVIEGRVEKVLPALWENQKPERPFILLDPPRQGITADLAGFLSRLPGTGALAYVSCDPVTLARDLKIILSSSAWRVKEIAPFDMFPRTKHIEVAVLLVPKSSV